MALPAVTQGEPAVCGDRGVGVSSAVSPVGGSSAQLVAPERTPVAVRELRAALGRAYVRVTGAPATSAVLQTLTAQASVETGRGQSMYNFNFGGVKGASPRGQSASCLTHEVTGGQTVTVRQSFRAYASLDEGAEDYVRLMVTRFGGAMPSAATGNLDSFAHALKQAGYYTASESDYAAALKGASGELPASPCSPVLPVPCASSLPTSIDVARLFDALSGAALRIADPDR